MDKLIISLSPSPSPSPSLSNTARPENFTNCKGASPALINHSPHVFPANSALIEHPVFIFHLVGVFWQNECQNPLPLEEWPIFDFDANDESRAASGFADSGDSASSGSGGAADPAAGAPGTGGKGGELVITTPTQRRTSKPLQPLSDQRSTDSDDSRLSRLLPWTRQATHNYCHFSNFTMNVRGFSRVITDAFQ